MDSRTALTLSIGVLGGLAVALTAEVITVPIWVVFLAWASFFFVGGGIAPLESYTGGGEPAGAPSAPGAAAPDETPPSPDFNPLFAKLAPQPQPEPALEEEAVAAMA